MYPGYWAAAYTLSACFITSLRGSGFVEGTQSLANSSTWSQSTAYIKVGLARGGCMVPSWSSGAHEVYKALAVN